MIKGVITIMKNSIEKTVNKFKKKIKKGQSVFIISHDHDKSILLGLKEDIILDTLLIHKKVDGSSLVQGYINNKPIKESSPISIFLDLEEIDYPEVYFHSEDQFDVLSEFTEDLIVIFCEFVPYSILFYVFNTPYSQRGKKSISAGNKPLTDYFKHLFLNTLPNDQRQIIQDSLYAEHSDEKYGDIVMKSKKQKNTINLFTSDDDDFDPNEIFASSSITQKNSLNLFTSDDDDFHPDEILFDTTNNKASISSQQKNTHSHELSIKISKEDNQSSYPKSISDNDLAELLIKENHLIILNNILHYWSESKNHYIPLIGDAADKFIRLRTPTPYKRRINQKSIGEILQWLKTNDNLNVDHYIDSEHRYIGFQNGIYDIYLDRLLAHSPDYFLVNIIQSDYPDENLYDNSGEHFEQFLLDITEGNPDLYDRLQELFGYVLSEIRSVKCIPFLVGVKDTGKSIVLKLLETLIGEDSYTNLSFDQLNAPVFLAELIGKKLNTCGELGEFKLNRLDVFKKLSGGDSLLAKPLYEKPIKFKNTAALLFAGNHLPVIKGLDKANAFSNRLVIFPFTNPIPKELCIC